MKPLNSCEPISYPQIAEKLKSETNLIINLWEAEVRQKVDAAKSMPKLALVDSLPEFLAKMFEALIAIDKAGKLAKAGEAGRKHGEDRAYQSNYTVAEVLSEYWILRTVIFETLEKDVPLPVPARNIVLAVFDEAIRRAVEEFGADRARVLEQSNRDLENFASVAAHDLKSPLATIAGYLEIIGEEMDPAVSEEILGYITTTKRATAHMSIMIDKLLQYSIVGRAKAPFKKSSIAEIVEQVKSNLSVSLKKANAIVKVGPLPTLSVEPVLLAMVFQNLIGNSVKFKSEAPPQISVTATAEGNFWVFKVQDNGVGFDSSNADSLFALFKQFHNSLRSQGFGIGLATARKVIEIHGGKIWATSEPGAGSCFYFTLPI